MSSCKLYNFNFLERFFPVLINNTNILENILTDFTSNNDYPIFIAKYNSFINLINKAYNLTPPLDTISNCGCDTCPTYCQTIADQFTKNYSTYIYSMAKLDTQKQIYGVLSTVLDKGITVKEIINILNCLIDYLNPNLNIQIPKIDLEKFCDKTYIHSTCPTNNSNNTICPTNNCNNDKSYKIISGILIAILVIIIIFLLVSKKKR